MKDFEAILEKVGSFGLFQKRLYVIVFLAGIPNALYVLNFVFTHHLYDFHCKFPEQAVELLYKNLTTYEELLNLIVPFEYDASGELRRSRCYVYDRNISELIGNETLKNETAKRYCSDGWEYKMESYQSTAISDFNMVCNKDWQPAVVVSLYSVGLGIGSCMGVLSDKFGRRPVFLAATAGQVVVIGLAGLTWDFGSYAVLTLINGCFSLVNYAAGFVLATEITGVKGRNFIAVSSFYSFALGCCFVAGLSYFIQQWRWYLFAISMISALQFPYWWLIPESPRWLITAGKIKEAKRELKRIAKMNGKDVDVEELIKEDMLEKYKSEPKKPAKNNIVKMLSNPKIRSRYWSLFYGWSVIINGLNVYPFSQLVIHIIRTVDGPTKNDGNVDDALWDKQSVIGLDFKRAPQTLSPGSRLLRALVLTTVGAKNPSTHRYVVANGCRKVIASLPIIGFSFLTKVQNCPSDAFVDETGHDADLLIVISILALIGKGACSAVFYAIFIITSELTPTMERNTTLGIASACARIGGFLAPYIMYLGKFGKAMPYFVMAFLSLTSGVLSYTFIPETKGIIMPDSVKDAEANRRFYSWKFWISLAEKGCPEEKADNCVMQELVQST